MPVAFPLGRMVITRNALMTLQPDEIFVAVRRHARGDWGDTDPDDSGVNDEALRAGDQLLSVYHTEARVQFWIITEWDRSVTTILLPEDY